MNELIDGVFAGYKVGVCVWIWIRLTTVSKVVLPQVYLSNDDAIDRLL